MSVDPSAWVYTLVILLLAAVFSGLEVAFLAADKLSIALEGPKRGISGRIMGYFVRYPERFLGTTMIASTLAINFYSVYVAQSLGPYLRQALPEVLQAWGGEVFAETLLGVLVYMLFAEFIPKSIFLGNPSYVLGLFAWPLAVTYAVLWPWVVSSLQVTRWIITRILKQEYIVQAPAFDLYDLQEFLKRLALEQGREEAHVVAGLVDIGRRNVASCMVRVQDMPYVNLHESPELLRQTLAETKQNYMLIRQAYNQELVGYCRVRDVLQRPASIAEVVHTLAQVRDNMSVLELLGFFIKEKKRLAKVVDAYGNVLGLVSREEVVARIFNLPEECTGTTCPVEHSEELYAQEPLDRLDVRHPLRVYTADYTTLQDVMRAHTSQALQPGERMYISPLVCTIITMEGDNIGWVRVEQDDTLKKAD